MHDIPQARTPLHHAIIAVMRRLIVMLAAALVLAARQASAQSAPQPSPSPSPSPGAYVRALDAGLHEANATLEYRFLGRNVVDAAYRRWSADLSELSLRSSFVGSGHTYLTTASLTRWSGSGAPRVSAPFGVGLEEIADPRRPVSVSASVLYYPEVHGNSALPGGNDLRVRYALTTLDLGLTAAIPNSAGYLRFGVAADRTSVKANAPAASSQRALTLGAGVRR
jgi:hypothetical protein